MAALGHVDALVFTAGVGQHSDVIRRMVCAGLENLGIALDEEKNLAGPRGTVTEIQAPDSSLKVLVIPTNEELEIASQTEAVVKL
jgi:acetate kinase